MDETKTEKINDYRWGSKESLQKLNEYRIAIKNGSNERDAADKTGVPRSTLRFWNSPIRTSYTEKSALFLQTEDGYLFLHKIVMTAMITFVTPGLCGIRQFCRWLVDSNLSDFVASSYGVWQKISKDIERVILQFAKETQGALSKNMQYK